MARQTHQMSMPVMPGSVSPAMTRRVSPGKRKPKSWPVSAKMMRQIPMRANPPNDSLGMHVGAPVVVSRGGAGRPAAEHRI
jgi:hypothetical protein